MNPAAAISRALVQPPVLVWRAYLGHLERNPRTTKSFTSVIAAFAGDALAQHISNRDKRQWEYDWGRTLRLAAFNAGMGVFGHEYYQVLDGRVMPHASKSPRAIATKLVIDQLVFAPICTAVFYSFKCLTEGRPREYVAEMEEKFVPTVMAGWKLWIPAHALNFATVPNRQRILYTNVVSIFGTYILSRAQAGDYSKPSAASAQQATEVVFDGVMLKEE